MWPFNMGEQMPPRRWKDLSLEFKAFFFYHLAMMILFALPAIGRKLDYAEYLFVAAAIGLLITIVSAIRRARAGWHWRGAGWKEGVSVAILTVLFAIFVSSGPTTFPPPPQMMPWYLATLGIYTFAALQFLHIVHFSEADFRADCGDAASAPRPEPPREAPWKRAVRAAFSIFFLAVWLEGMAFFYFSSQAINHGADEPTGAQTWSVDDHGRHHYVTKEEYDRIELLKGLFFIGAPSAIFLTAFLQFVLGIKMGWPSRDDKSA